MGCGSSVPAKPDAVAITAHQPVAITAPVTAIAVRNPQRSAVPPTPPKAYGGPTDEELSCYVEANKADVAANTQLVSLPVSIHLVRDGSYSLTPADFAADGPIFDTVNRTWRQANICWQVLSVTEHTLDSLPWLTAGELQGGAIRERSLFDSAVKPLRNTTCYQIFIHAVLPQHSQREGAIQGFARGNGPRSTCHIGAWSTKGFTHPTERSREHIARTMCHELGHALSLAHTKTRAWADGSYMAGCHPCTFQNTQDAQQFRNVMAGNTDKAGGAGGHLEPWQVVQARRCALSLSPYE